MRLQQCTVYTGYFLPKVEIKGYNAMINRKIVIRTYNNILTITTTQGEAKETIWDFSQRTNCDSIVNLCCCDVISK